MLRQQFRIMKTQRSFKYDCRRILEKYQITIKNANPLKLQILTILKEVFTNGRIKYHEIDDEFNYLERKLTNIQQKQHKMKTERGWFSSIFCYLTSEMPI